ncbi:hypothetical protein [Microbulbifer spongiae]|uniref:DUF805 domain-containing protein n=1 Tax=Microbulbifer spongiae TaxID=2944933 RepID=A0ABY9EFX5_9GAMM|nr:hypothetical protein [Microbulbifer sp. MI-G]WKD51112.1 hypothetical protein M8T91_06725 [Microbulbifer sp. MI-G]
MRIDYPLFWANSKLPTRAPSFYLKWLAFLFVGNIVVLFAQAIAEIDMARISVLFETIALLMFISCFCLCITTLYNKKPKLGFWLETYFPSVAENKAINLLSKGSSSLNHWALVIFCYLLLASIVAIALSLAVQTIKS